MDKSFTLEDLKDIVKKSEKKVLDTFYTTSQFYDGMVSSLMEVAQEVKKELVEVVRNTLKKDEQWSLEHFLFLTSSFLFEDILKLQFKVFSYNKSDKITKEIDIELDKNEKIYVMVRLPNEDYLSTYKHSLIFLLNKKNKNLFYISEEGYPILFPVYINFKELNSELKNLNNKCFEEPINLYLCEKFRKIIYSHILDQVVNDILSHYKLHFNFIYLSKEKFSIEQSPIYFLELGKNPAEIFSVVNSSFHKFLSPNDFSYMVKSKLESSPNFLNCALFRLHFTVLKINQILIDLILFNHYKIEERHAEQGLECDIPMNNQDVSKLLQDELGEEYHHSKIPDLCFRSSFNVYVRLPSSTFEKGNRNFIISDLSQVEYAIEQNLLDKNYLHHYNGLYRLHKKIPKFLSPNFKLFGDINAFQHTLKYLCDGGKIKINSRSCELFFQQSLSQFILEVQGFFKPDLSFDKEIVITSDNFLYLRHEVMDFIKFRKSQILIKNNSNSANKNKRLEILKWIEENEETISAEVRKKSDVYFDIKNMPGTKKEFLNCLKRKYPKLFSISLNTFSEYIESKFKFSPGKSNNWKKEQSTLVYETLFKVLPSELLSDQ